MRPCQSDVAKIKGQEGDDSTCKRCQGKVKNTIIIRMYLYVLLSRMRCTIVLVGFLNLFGFFIIGSTNVIFIVYDYLLPTYVWLVRLSLLYTIQQKSATSALINQY